MSMTSGADSAPEISHVVIDSPLGPITLVASGERLCGLYLDHPANLGGRRLGPEGAEALDGIIEQLGEYFAGTRQTFEVALAPEGTEFQRTVWDALCEIPYGATESYGEVADRIGRHGSARAVGMANGRNPISIVVPCHRVIGADGTLTGYGWGLAKKSQLIELERRALQARTG